MNLEQTADFISEGLPRWQRDENLVFLQNIHVALHDDGIWMYPAANMIFTKTGEGFELTLDS